MLYILLLVTTTTFYTLQSLYERVKIMLITTSKFQKS